MILSSESLKFYEKNIPFDAVSRPCGVGRRIIGIASYENLDHLLRSTKTASGLTNFNYQYNKINGVLFLLFGKNEGITIPDLVISSIHGFNGIHDGSGYHTG